MSRASGLVDGGGRKGTADDVIKFAGAKVRKVQMAWPLFRAEQRGRWRSGSGWICGVVISPKNIIWRRAEGKVRAERELMTEHTSKKRGWGEEGKEEQKSRHTLAKSRCGRLPRLIKPPGKRERREIARYADSWTAVGWLAKSQKTGVLGVPLSDRVSTCETL